MLGWVYIGELMEFYRIWQQIFAISFAISKCESVTTDKDHNMLLVVPENADEENCVVHNSGSC